MKKALNLLQAGFLSVALATSAGVSLADDGAQSFVQREHVKVTELLKQPASPARDGQINRALEAMVDYEELTRRAFGSPCPITEPACTNHWMPLSDAQKVEVTDLLKRLVEKNYRKNLIKTLDYEVTFKGSKEQAGDQKIRTEAKSKLKPRDPVVQVDYVVRSANANFHVIDIVTEGSSLTKNYYTHITKKLNEKILKVD
jgi:ABC-type transporter MlaC component